MEKLCDQCPRACRCVRGDGKTGYCGMPWGFRIARAALHRWEEPCVSGEGGSGTIFFSGCNLRCVFCQNREISREGLGREIGDDELARLMLRLRDEGAENINLVTPTHYARQLIPVLRRVRPELGIPVLYNCGGYESVGTLRALEGLIDIYLPDVKYYSPERSGNYSGARDYFPVAVAALREMLRQTGAPAFDERGMIRSGVIVRHLVLPGGRADSIRVLEELAKEFGNRSFLLSLMSQYTPKFASDAPYPELHRRVTTFEYQSVLDAADRLGFDGYRQQISSASGAYVPDFHEVTF